MSEPIFDPDRCPVPAIDKLPRTPFILDCEIPEAPGPILECPDTAPPEPQLPPLDALTIIGGGDGGGRNNCPPGVGLLCTETYNAVPIEGEALPVSNLYFRKDSSFRVWGIPSACDPQNKIDALIDIGGGPSDSVFWQPAGGGPPLWTTGLRLGTFVVVGTTEQPGWLLSLGTGGSIWGFAARPAEDSELTAIAYWYKPNNVPSPGSHLICDAANGSYTGLRWSYAGVTGDVTVDGKTLHINAGLITGVTGASVNNYESVGSVEIDTTFPQDFRPCQ